MYSRIKPLRVHDFREVTYSSEHWKLLKKLRRMAINLMKPLVENGIPCIVHGSIARGDVTKDSDIDIFITHPIPPYKLEVALESAGINVMEKRITQATPHHLVKAFYIIDERSSIALPLCQPRRLEREFYKFSGELTLEQLLKNKRVPGVNKNLILIVPTEKGHIEMEVIGRESEVSKVLGVSIDIVQQRVRILTRRDAVGRTGLYINYVLSPDESIEEALKKIALKFGTKDRLAEVIRP